MKKLGFIVLLIAAVGLSAGCQDFKKASAKLKIFKEPAKEEEKPLVEFVENADLAKVILKPERKPLTISRDPFKPLITKEMAAAGDLDNKIIPTGQEQALEDVVLIGVVKLGEESRAYFKTGDKTGVFKIQDKIRGFTIEEINIDSVVLKSGDRKIVKKRGKK